MRSQWDIVVGSSRQRNDATYLGFGFEGRLPVGMGEGLHDRVIVIRGSIQKLTADLWGAKKLLPVIRMLDNILPERGERIRLGVPNSTAYTTRQRQRSRGREKQIKGVEGVPTKDPPGWKWT